MPGAVRPATTWRADTFAHRSSTQGQQTAYGHARPPRSLQSRNGPEADQGRGLSYWAPWGMAPANDNTAKERVAHSEDTTERGKAPRRAAPGPSLHLGGRGGAGGPPQLLLQLGPGATPEQQAPATERSQTLTAAPEKLIAQVLSVSCGWLCHPCSSQYCIAPKFIGAPPPPTWPPRQARGRQVQPAVGSGSPCS